MNFTIEKLEIDGYWQVKYFGNISAQERAAAFKEGLKAAEGKKVYGVLVDMTDAKIKLGVIEQYQFAEKKGKSGRLIGARVASLLVPEEIENERFQSLVLNNFGLQSEIFTDKEEALNWLVRPEHKKS